MTIEDPKALTKPWIVTKQFRKQPEGPASMTMGAQKTTAIRLTSPRARP